MQIRIVFVKKMVYRAAVLNCSNNLESTILEFVRPKKVRTSHNPFIILLYFDIPWCILCKSPAGGMPVAPQVYVNAEHANTPRSVV